MKKFNKTKIIVTLGPSTFDIEKIKKLIKIGVDVFRINFSHGSYEDYKNIIDKIRKYDETIALMADLKGTEIRTHVQKENGIKLKQNDEIDLVYDNKKVGNNNFSLHYSKVLDISKKGRHILIDDGKIDFVIEEVKRDRLKLRSLTDGVLKNRKSAHFAETDVPFPLLTSQDKKDIEFAKRNNFDFVAASMIKSEKEIYAIRGLLNEEMQLLAKIEHPKAVYNIDSIIDASDMILVARGDLGVKMPITKVPVIQKNITDKAKKAGKPVIIATQLLESMVENPRPTRAEVNDIASAIVNMVDALMLTGETAAGQYPIESVEMLKEVIKNTEDSINYENYLQNIDVNKGNISESISYAAVDASYSLPARAILCFTSSGATARRVAKFRPQLPIYAFTQKKNVVRQLRGVFGVIPFTIGHFNTMENMIDEGKRVLLKNKFIKPDNKIVITSGTPIGRTGTTNTIKIIEV
ncbi:MAG: pyruvate kinase [Candidatus Mcinerneyibacterium aminivorans]|uniref:Pyruvate kinase n=1 Tax=Candidatus Mcinerneyibacterium aminivorans TaxID=2703815 RepID=A0A5D0MJM9_9BACT|nr:MAG: pyruvate kinase [Candidatus Mcinerneyibacterium aminivorans]